MRYKSENVVNVDDVKTIIRDYISKWSKIEMENNIKVWFDNNHSVKDKYDEG